MILEDKDLEVIGSPNVVLYDDTTIIVQHIETGYWMSYKVGSTDNQVTIYCKATLM